MKGSRALHRPGQQWEGASRELCLHPSSAAATSVLLFSTRFTFPRLPPYPVLRAGFTGATAGLKVVCALCPSHLFIRWR